MTGQIVQTLNVVLIFRSHRGIVEALLQIERGNRLVVEGDLYVVGAIQSLGIQRNLILDGVCACKVRILATGAMGSPP